MLNTKNPAENFRSQDGNSEYDDNLVNTNEKHGKPGSDPEQEKLMHSVLESDKKSIDQGHLLIDAINQGLFSFNPDMMMEHMVNNYNLAKQMYGETFLKAVTGYDESMISRNIKIPEFQRELKRRVNQTIEQLKDDDLIDREKEITDKGLELAALTLYTEELDNMVAKGLIGEKKSEKTYHYGTPFDYRAYKKGDRYKDIALKKSIRASIRKRHTSLEKEDLQIMKREGKGHIELIYGLDASGSMKGNKINLCKKAGIALAFKAIEENDKVGLIVFGSEIENVVRPTTDFMLIMKEIAKIRAKKETNIVATIKKAIEIFPSSNESTKHLILITDGLPTTGKDPEKETLESVSEAISNSITISVIGINLDEKGKNLCEKMTQLGNGKLYIVKDLENLDTIVLQDYYSL